MTYLPDTNACITLLRERNSKLVARWIQAIADLLCPLHQLRRKAYVLGRGVRLHSDWLCVSDWNRWTLPEGFGYEHKF